MPALTFYPAFLGTFLSITCLTYLAWREHNPSLPRTLSELAADRRQTLKYFRIVLWTCGTLFAITMFFFVVPRVHYSLLQLLAWIPYYGGELLLAIVPARGPVEVRLHNGFAYAMSVSMLATAILFVANFHGITSTIELGTTGAMAILGILTFVDRKRFIFYELPFIYLSHISILVAALAI
jgi:hypothetical protein